MVYRAPGLPARTYYYSLIPFRKAHKINHVMLLMEDITDMIRLGEEVRKAERHLASVIESASDIVLSMCPSGQILTWNTAAVNIIGFDQREVRNRNLADFCVESQRQTLVRALERVQHPAPAEPVEVELISRAGEPIPISWVFSAMRDTEGRVIALVAVGRNLTERRKFEAQLLQTEKLAALGVMAGGIAHELRNPMAVVSSAAQLLLSTSLRPELANECAQRIFTGVQRAAGIIENLLCFARPSDKGKKADLDLVLVVHEAVTFLRNQAQSAGLEIQVKCPDTPVPVLGNACLLQQLIANLVTNSAHAIAGSGGKISVILDRSEAHAVLFISDTGCGIPTAHLNKVFDPFFTAMPMGRGTGLGLSICHTIVQQHDGTIEIASREGHGTTVKVLLPLLTHRGSPGKRPSCIAPHA